MTPSQLFIYELGQASTEEDVVQFWSKNRQELRNCSIIFGAPGPSAFGNPFPERFGRKARLICPFAGQNLFFINDRIYDDILAGRRDDVRIAPFLSFDTNTASYVRKLFQNRGDEFSQDLHQVLLHFSSGDLNWQILPYLNENFDKIRRGLNDRDIFETVLAVEKLGMIDIPYLRAEGKIRESVGATDPLPSVVKLLSHAARHFTGGLSTEIVERWELMYVAVLFMALQQAAMLGRQLASRKFRALVEFMDVSLHMIATELLIIAWDWFSGGENTLIFNELQINATELLAKAQNISWDIFHLVQMRQEITYRSDRQSFNVPFFLTFDSRLAEVIKLCAIKTCLIEKMFDYPTCVPHRNLETALPLSIVRDRVFMDRFFSPKASQKRMAFIQSSGRPDLSTIRQELETRLLALQ